MEVVSLRKKVSDLEEEYRKLSGQQNLQQRIHHHAKIKVRCFDYLVVGNCIMDR